MRVNPNNGPLDTSGIPSRSPARAVRLDQDTVVLSGTEALKRALDQTPSVRPEQVARAKALLQDPTYPPDTLLTQIATLLAAQISAQK